MSLIALKNVRKSFKTGDTETIALHDINIQIELGELVAIMGPSGSGKSTLMHILGLLDTPSGGEYLLEDSDVANRKDKALAQLRRHKIGFVFQSFNLLPRLSVAENVMLPMAYAGLSSRKRKERAFDLLQLVGLADRANYRPNQISGGQTQRAAIARALANQPSLILADEPTGNLDTQSSQAVIAMLQNLHQQGNTVIIVTHNPEIAAVCDRIIEIRDGRVVAPSSSRKSPAESPSSTPHQKRVML